MARPWRSRSEGLARDTTFLMGGTLVIGLGVALAVGLVWAAAGWDYFSAWLGAAIAVGFGVFFIAVGRGERQERRRFLRSVEEGTPPSGLPPR